jgi:hypothetical protein
VSVEIVSLTDWYRSVRPGEAFLSDWRVRSAATETAARPRRRRPQPTTPAAKAAAAPRTKPAAKADAPWTVEIDRYAWDRLSADADSITGAEGREFGTWVYGERVDRVFRVHDSLAAVQGTATSVSLTKNPPDEILGDRLLGSAHSHPGCPLGLRWLSAEDVRAAESHCDLLGRPELSVLITIGVDRSWTRPTIDAFVTHFDWRFRGLLTRRADVVMKPDSWRLSRRRYARDALQPSGSGVRLAGR